MRCGPIKVFLQWQPSLCLVLLSKPPIYYIFGDEDGIQILNSVSKVPAKYIGTSREHDGSVDRQDR